MTTRPPPILPLEQPEKLVQHIRETARRRVRVEQPGDTAKEVPEQVARPRLGGDVEMHLVEMDQESKQVEIQRTKCQIENLT